MKRPAYENRTNLDEFDTLFDLLQNADWHWIARSIQECTRERRHMIRTATMLSREEAEAKRNFYARIRGKEQRERWNEMSDEEKAAWIERTRQGSKAFWDGMDRQTRYAFVQKIADRRWSPERRAEHARKMKERWASKTPEERQAFLAKVSASRLAQEQRRKAGTEPPSRRRIPSRTGKPIPEETPSLGQLPESTKRAVLSALEVGDLTPAEIATEYGLQYHTVYRLSKQAKGEEVA